MEREYGCYKMLYRNMLFGRVHHRNPAFRWVIAQVTTTAEPEGSVPDTANRNPAFRRAIAQLTTTAEPKGSVPNAETPESRL